MAIPIRIPPARDFRSISQSRVSQIGQTQSDGAGGKEWKFESARSVKKRQAMDDNDPPASPSVKGLCSMQAWPRKAHHAQSHEGHIHM